MKVYKIYKAGAFSTTSNELVVYNPYNQSAFAKTYLAGNTDLNECIVEAKNVEEEMKNLPSHKRYNILMQISKGIKDNRKDMAETLAKQSGKPMKYSLGEVDRAAQGFMIAAEESKRLPKEYISIDWTEKGEGKEGLVKHFPVGLVAGISPFNTSDTSTDTVTPKPSSSNSSAITSVTVPTSATSESRDCSSNGRTFPVIAFITSTPFC